MNDAQVAVVAMIKLFFICLFRVLSCYQIWINGVDTCVSGEEIYGMVFDKSSGAFVNHWKFKFQTQTPHTLFLISLFPLSCFQCCDDVEFGAENFAVGNATVCYIHKISRSAPKMFSVYFQLMAIIFQTFRS